MDYLLRLLRPILLLISLNIISGCAVATSFIQSKEDQLYHSGKYAELVDQLELSFPGEERYRILAENRARIVRNQPTNFDLIRYHFYTRYLIHSLIETGKLEEAERLCDRAIKENNSLSNLFQQYHYGLRSSVELNEENFTKLQLYKGYITWFRTGDYNKAVKYFSAIKLDNLSPKDKIYVLLDQGFFYDKIIGDYAKSLAQLEEVIRLTENLGLFDTDSKYAYSLQAYRRMMQIYTTLGRLERGKKILDAYENSTGKLIFKFGKSMLGSSQYFRGYLSMMDASAGALFALSRDFDKSKEYFDRAWNVVKNIDEHSDHMWDQNALGTYFVLYGTYYLGLQNKYKEAVDYVDRGLNHLRPYYIEAIETEIDIESAYIYSAELHYKLGNLGMALRRATEAIEYSERYHNKIKTASAYTLIGQIHLTQNEIIGAQNAFQNALAQIGQVESTENWKLFFGMGQVYEMSDDVSNAVSFYRRAAADVEKLWEGRFKDVNKQLSFLEDRLSVYEPLIRLLINQGKTEEAVSFMEKSKSRTAYETSPYYHTESSLSNRGYSASPDNTVTSNKTLTASEIKKLLPADTVLLEYYVGDKSVMGAVISSNKKIYAKILPITSQQLKEKVKRFRETVDSPRSDEYYIEEGVQLYAELVKPFENYLSEYQRLGIVPHGVLHYLPFQALVTNKEGEIIESSAVKKPRRPMTKSTYNNAQLNRPTFLVDHYSIFYSPSATILSIAHNHNTMRRGKLLAIGSPPEIKFKDSSSQIRLYEKLSSAEEEISKAGTFFQSKQVFVDSEATETAVKKYAADYDVLLFPVHGEFNNLNPLRSCLVFKKDSENDGLLTVGEIEKMNFNASLIVLSACESGLVASYKGMAEDLTKSDFPLGDDLFGLQRAFIKSGSASILSTLWKVDSESTASLVAKFFEQYRIGSDKASALQSAQRYLMQSNQDWMRPYYWAPFVLSGDWL